MSEEVMAIRGWAQNALNCAVTERNQKRKVSDYDRGRIAGIISAYQHVLVETAPTAVWRIPHSAFNLWIDNITTYAPLSVGDAIDIHFFCESNDMLSTDNIIETVIALGNVGLSRYQIKFVLGLNIVKRGGLLNRVKRGRRSRDE